MPVPRPVLALVAAGLAYLGLIRGSAGDPALLAHGLPVTEALKGVVGLGLAGLVGWFLPDLLGASGDGAEDEPPPPETTREERKAWSADFYVPSAADLGLVEVDPLDGSEGQTITRVLEANEQLALAEGLAREGDWESVAPFFKRALQLNPANSKAIAVLCCDAGKGLYDQGETEKAASGFSIAVQYEPGSAPTHTMLAQCLVQLGDFPRATEHFLEACALEPEDHHPFFNLGVFYEKTKRGRDAIKAFRRVVDLKPDSLDAHYFLSRLFATDRQHEEERRHLEECARLAPTTPQGEWAARRLKELEGRRG